MPINVVNPEIRGHWITVINSIFYLNNIGDKYAVKYLIWFLHYSNWNKFQLSGALYSYDIQSIPFILKNISKIGHCLSFRKQVQIKEVLKEFKYNYKIWSPDILYDALSYITPTIDIKRTNRCIFDLVDFVFEYDKNPWIDNDGSILEQSVNMDSPCELIQIYKWLRNNESLDCYDILSSIYPLVSHNIQRDIIKKYFYDIKQGRIELDINLLRQFKENDYADLVRFRHCLYSPEEPIFIGNNLLADCLITLIETNGLEYQAFDGLLDLLVQNCDSQNPSVDFGFQSFLPTCNGGVIVNRSFRGFIDYAITYSIDSEKLDSEYMEAKIRDLFDKYFRKKRACIYKSNDIASCLKSKLSLECLGYDENVWVAQSNNFPPFLKDNFSLEIEDGEETLIKWNDRYIADYRKLIYTISKKHSSVENGACLFMASEIFSDEFKLYENHSHPVTMRIYPRTDVYVKSSNDIKGYIDMDMSETERGVEQSLTEFLPKQAIYNGRYFELPYDKNLLSKVKSVYYYNGSIEALSEKGSNFLWIANKPATKYPILCAPKFSTERIPAVKLPFFWCRGKECFRNVLDKQLVESSDWSRYTLYQMSEIIGYSKLHETEAGYEADESISRFIYTANRAIKQFRRLCCEKCGHLIYPIKNQDFNRHNNYSCINPNCSEYNKPLYLNYCYNCKTGLIDSRISKRCPNGLYICPECLSCCNDQLYDNAARKYELSNQPVPQGIQKRLGQGHNDHDIYYCPYCGCKLEDIPEHKMHCSQCGKDYIINQMANNRKAGKHK